MFDSGLPISVIIGAAAGYLLVKVLQYVLVARVYLTCAARVMQVAPADVSEISKDEHEILESVDDELSRAGFRPLLTARLQPLLTYHEGAEFIRVFVSEREPIRALVTRRLLSETGFVVAVELETPLANGRTLLTRDSSKGSDLLTLFSRDEESLVGADVAGLQRRHKERLRACATSVDTSTFEPAGALRALNEFVSGVRSQMLSGGYIARSRDPDLDRFTLIGAFRFAHRTLRVARSKPPMAAVIRSPESIEAAARLRVLADMNSLRRMAQHPVRAPGSNYPLWVMMAATAVVSFAGMSLVWSPLTAVVILAVIAFHEAGHAVAMRVAGYRDVNIFFVPFVGALTVGRDSGSSVRQRLMVMLAGPVPGLWLAVIVLVLQHHVEGLPILRPLAFALLFVNALNLLPITPLDGGRALELLTSPASTLRLLIQGVSGLGLLGLGAYLQDALLVVLGLWWLFLLRRQLPVWRLRRKVNSMLGDAPTELEVMTAVCTALSAPAYSTWRSTARLATARLFVQQSAQIAPTTGDRVMALSLYAFAWLPAAVALLIWSGHLAV